MKRASSGKEVNKKRGTVDKLTTIRGIVIPADWDEEGNMLAVAISGSDEQEYLIEQNAKGKELLKLIRHEIEIDGLVRKAIKGRKTVKVKSYRLKMYSDW